METTYENDRSRLEAAITARILDAMENGLEDENGDIVPPNAAFIGQAIKWFEKMGGTSVAHMTEGPIAERLKEIRERSAGRALPPDQPDD